MQPNTNVEKVISELRTLTNKNEAQKTIGILKYLSNFIPNLAKQMRRTIKLLRKPEEEFKWTDGREKKLKRMVKQLKHTPTLYYPDSNKPFRVFTDANQHGIGFYLIQGDTEDEQIVMVGHRTLSRKERDMSTIDRELLTLELAPRKIIYLTNGKEAKASTDHNPLAISGQSLIKENYYNSRTSDDIDMKLGLVTKLDKRHKATLKKFDNDVMSENCNVIVIFPNFGQFGATWKLDSRCIVCKTYIFINSNLLSYRN